jgi:hypothetical protein
VAAALVAIASTVGAAVVLAILGGMVRMTLSVRDSARATADLTAAVARLVERQDEQGERLAAVEAVAGITTRPRNARGGRSH